LGIRRAVVDGSVKSHQHRMPNSDDLARAWTHHRDLAIHAG